MTSVGFGVVEGFYGRPWSHAARLSMVRFLRDVELDTYLRAPKNDPDRLASADHRLGGAAKAELAELFALGASLGVRVGCVVAPSHVAELARLGGRTFVVAFDDTLATFVRPAATFERGRRHGEAALHALRAAREIDASTEVFLVPAVYSGRAPDLSRRALAYLRGIGSIAPSIPVAWTGPNIFSRLITPGDAIALQRETGLGLWIWNNVIANDWLPLLTGELVGFSPSEKLSFGPVDNLAFGLRSAVSGILVNGAREPELTKISLASFADWKRDERGFDASASHAQAIARVVGPGPAANIIEAVYDWTRAHPLSSPARFEARDLSDAVSRYRRMGTSADRVVEELARIIAIAVQARKLAPDHAAVAEALPTIEAASLVAETGLLAIEGAPLGDRRERKLRARALDDALRRVRRSAWRVGLDPVLELARLRA